MPHPDARLDRLTTWDLAIRCSHADADHLAPPPTTIDDDPEDDAATDALTEAIADEDPDGDEGEDSDDPEDDDGDGL